MPAPCDLIWSSTARGPSSGSPTYHRGHAGVKHCCGFGGVRPPVPDVTICSRVGEFSPGGRGRKNMLESRNCVRCSVGGQTCTRRGGGSPGHLRLPRDMETGAGISSARGVRPFFVSAERGSIRGSPTYPWNRGGPKQCCGFGGARLLDQDTMIFSRTRGFAPEPRRRGEMFGRRNFAASGARADVFARGVGRRAASGCPEIWKTSPESAVPAERNRLFRKLQGVLAEAVQPTIGITWERGIVAGFGACAQSPKAL